MTHLLALNITGVARPFLLLLQRSQDHHAIQRSQDHHSSCDSKITRSSHVAIQRSQASRRDSKITRFKTRFKDHKLQDAIQRSQASRRDSKQTAQTTATRSDMLIAVRGAHEQQSVRPGACREAHSAGRAS